MIFAVHNIKLKSHPTTFFKNYYKHIDIYYSLVQFEDLLILLILKKNRSVY